MGSLVAFFAAHELSQSHPGLMTDDQLTNTSNMIIIITCSA
jgi:hypothetical protein